MRPKQWMRFGALAVLLLVLAALPASGALAQQSVLDRAVAATVRILGCNLSGCNVGLGSGVVIHPSGVILTANHVTLTDARNSLSPHLEDFVIELTQNARSAPVARYRARLLAAKPESDLALLGIYWDEIAHRSLDDTSAIDLPALPIADAGAIALGEQLHILGYPLAGGAAINYTQAALGGFDEGGALLKANVSLNEGYSGGPALVERDGQYQITGVVVSRRADVSYIRSVDQLGGMSWSPGARRVWADNVRVTTTGSGANDTLRISADIHALDYAGRQGRLLAYAYHANKGSPWSPADAAISGGPSGNLSKAPNGQFVLRKDFGVDQSVETGRAVSMEIPWSATGGDPRRLLFRLILWDAEAAQALWRGPEWYAILPATGTGSPTQIPPSAFSPSVPPTSRATSMPVPPATPAPGPTWTLAPTPIATHTATRPPTPTRTPTPLPPTTAPTPALAPGSTRVSDKDGMVMAYVPAGEFLMGSTDADTEASDDEKLQHKVYLDAFWIDRTEVSNEMFAHFVVDTGYKTDAEKSGSSVVFYAAKNQWEETKGADWRHPRGPGSGTDGLESRPVVHVSWNDAVAYCRWAGRRLPTEAEWEKAARGTQGSKYPWGTDQIAGHLLNFCDRQCPFDYRNNSIDDGFGETAPVGSYPAGVSPFGVLDLAGNVWEWTNTLWGGDPTNPEFVYPYNPKDGREDPNRSGHRIARGGSWTNLQNDIRAANRNWLTPEFRFADISFRCARGTSPQGGSS